MGKEDKLDSIVPVFIGGCERSGTTLLGAMLGAHSECLTTPESQFLIETLRLCDSEGSFVAQSAFDLIKRHWRYKIWELDVELTSQMEMVNSYARLIAWIVRQYGESIGKPAARFWVDHTPWNTQYGTTLFDLFPDAKMLHIVRDGRAVASSMLSLKDWALINTIDQAADHWLGRVAFGLAAESFWGEQRVVKVRYEDLVREPEAELKRICAFLGVDYQPSMVGGGGFRVPAYTSKQHALIGKPPDARRIDAWEDTLTPRQIEIFESITGDMLTYLGYVPKHGLSKRGMTKSERLVSAFLRQYLWGIKKIRHQLRIWKSVLGN